MEGVSILQLTSLTTIVTASIFLTWVAKRGLASVPIASKVPVWIYTGAIAAVLTYIANRVTGTLEGQTGVLMIDAVINGALASGIREWFTTATRPLEDSGTAREAIMDKEIKNRLGVWFLPLLLAGGLASGCAGLTPAPVTPNPAKVTTEKALQIATAVEKGSGFVVQVARATKETYDAKLITIAQRDAVLTAIIRIEPHAKDAPKEAHVLCASAFIDAIHAATTEPELRGAVQALMDLVTPLIASLPPALAQWVDTLKLAYQVASAYLGGGL